MYNPDPSMINHVSDWNTGGSKGVPQVIVLRDP